MLKKDLLRYMQRIINDEQPKENWLTQKDIDNVLSAFTQAVMELIAGGEHIKLEGLGTFRRVVYRGQTNYHPETRVVTTTKTKYIPSFKPCKSFKKLVSETEPVPYEKE